MADEIFDLKYIFKPENLNIAINPNTGGAIGGTITIPDDPLSAHMQIEDNDPLLEDNNNMAGGSAVPESQTKDITPQYLKNDVFGGSENGGSDAGDYVWSRGFQTIVDADGNEARLYQIRVGKWTPADDKGGVVDYEVEGGITTVKNYYAFWADPNQYTETGFKLSSGESFTITSKFNGLGNVEYEGFEVITCFVRGSQIETANGLVNVEDLKVGDQLRTKDNGIKAISWIGRSVVTPELLQKAPKMRAIRISKGALGQNIPAQDLFVSPQHRVLINSKIALRMFGESEVLVPAVKLTGIEGIDYVDSNAEIEYFHVMLDQHEIIYANGVETESFYAGKTAIDALSKEERDELLFLFPELLGDTAEYTPTPARMIVDRADAKQLVKRAVVKQTQLCEAS